MFDEIDRPRLQAGDFIYIHDEGIDEGFDVEITQADIDEAQLRGVDVSTIVMERCQRHGLH
jgi:hypothetical protein